MHINASEKWLGRLPKKKTISTCSVIEIKFILQDYDNRSNMKILQCAVPVMTTQK